MFSFQLSWALFAQGTQPIYLGHLQTAALRDSQFGKVLGIFHEENSNATTEVFPHFKFPFQTKGNQMFPREDNNFQAFLWWCQGQNWHYRTERNEQTSMGEAGGNGHLKNFSLTDQYLEHLTSFIRCCCYSGKFSSTYMLIALLAIKTAIH